MLELGDLSNDDLLYELTSSSLDVSGTKLMKYILRRLKFTNLYFHESSMCFCHRDSAKLQSSAHSLCRFRNAAAPDNNRASAARFSQMPC